MFTVCSFQYSGVLGTFLLVFPGVFSLFAACVFLLGFAWFSLFLLFFIFFAIFSYVPSEQPVDGKQKTTEKDLPWASGGFGGGAGS